MAKAFKAARRHPLSIGVLAAVLGVVLGVSVVYFDQREAVPVLAQGGGAGQACGQYGFSGNPPVNDKGLTQSQWSTCMLQQCKGGQKLATCPNTTDSFCKRHCITDYTTPNPTANNCCALAPNQGCTKVDGKCGGELPKEGTEKGKEGEMPKLPEIPKGGGGGSSPSADPCARDASSSECTSTQTPSGVGGFLGNLFGTNSDTEGAGTNAVSDALQSAASRLQSFLSGESGSAPAAEDAGAVNNPTEAVVTPVTPSASQAGQVASQTGGSQQGAANPDGAPGVSGTITGFGSGVQADAAASGGILTAISQTLAGIGAALRNLFGGLF